MSDFDDLFKNRLEEEASFPNRNKNWKQMSKRLDAFDTGKNQVGKGHLRYWQVATGLSIVVAAFFIWKYQDLARENQILHNERNLLQEEVLKQKPVASLHSQPEKTPEIPSPSAPSLRPGFSNSPTVAPGLASEGKGRELQSVNISQKQLSPQNASDTQGSNTPAPPQHSNAAPQTPTNLQEEAVGNETLVVAEAKHQDIVPSDGLPKANPEEDSLETRVAAKTPESPLAQPDSNAAKIKPVDSTQASIAQNPSPAPAAKEVKPHHERHLRFRAGIQGSVGWVQPKQKGVSALSGQGISFETRLLPSLWATTSVDWMQHEISTEEFVPRFHPHHDSLPRPKDNYPGGPQQHPDKLVQVQSNPREQHFSLGLRYAVPLHFWVKPSIQLSHEWVRISPNLITYKFVEDDPFMPPHHDEDRYTAEKFPAQWLNKQWHLAVGLEKEVPGWTFGVWADYSKSFTATTPSYDAFYLRLKAQYMF